MDIGVIQADGYVRVVYSVNDASAVPDLAEGETVEERHPGRQWGAGWRRTQGGGFIDPDGNAEVMTAVAHEISLNEFMARLPDAVVDAILDLEANATTAEGREVRRAMLRFRSSKNQMIDVNSPLVQGFLPKLAAMGVPQSVLDALVA